MGGLGNGRRGGRSPPLMIGALIACILLLGFNYWVSSSRNLELQTKLYELEGQVRRGAAERGVAEMKKNEFQEQMSHMESLFKRQLEGAQNMCSQEKGTMQQNISSSTKTIRELKDQLNLVNDDLGKLQKKLQSCQGDIKTLNDKLTYDMTHCDSQVLSQKALCDERVESAKLEVQRKMEKLIPHPVVSLHENAVDGPVEEGGTVITVANAVKTSTDEGVTPSLPQSKEKEPPELLTNKITENKGPDAPVDLPPVKDSSLKQPQSVPSEAVAVKQDVVLPAEGAVTTKTGEEDASKLMENNLPEDKGMELMDAHEEGALTEEADPLLDSMLTGEVKAEHNQRTPEESEDYDADEQIVGGVDLDKQQQKGEPENMDLEQELADYNGDDENEGEFEADKQAELAQI